MPYIDYTPAILTRKPIYQEGKLSTEVQDLGLTVSTGVLFNGEQIAAGEVSALQPYEKKIFSFFRKEFH